MAIRDWWLARVVKDIVQALRRNDVMLMAAGVAFYWLLGIIPLLLLGTSAIGYLLGSSDRAVDEVEGVGRLISPVGSTETLRSPRSGPTVPLSGVAESQSAVVTAA